MEKFKELANQLLELEYPNPIDLALIIESNFKTWINDNLELTPSRKRELIYIEQREVLDKKNEIESQIENYKLLREFDNPDWFVKANHSLRKTKQRLLFINQELSLLAVKEKEFNAVNSKERNAIFIDNMREYIIKKQGLRKWERIVSKCKTH